jgi:taurine dioxygenase
MIEAQKITPAIGAIITGVDFAAPLTSEIHDAIYQALLEHLVIFFRGTSIPPAAHLAFAESFGEVNGPHPLYPHVDGFGQIMKLENDANTPPDTDSWHTDMTFKTEPPFASVLIARTIPAVGGDTLWSSNYAAYDRLTDGMKTDLEHLDVIHDMGDFRNSFEGAINLAAGLEKFGNAIRPLIGTHPVTGRKFLNFNEAFCTHIKGLNSTQSNALKGFLSNHMNTPEDQMRWKWQEGDMAMWDNRVTMHYAVSDYLPAYRCMNRITVIRDRRVGGISQTI